MGIHLHQISQPGQHAPGVGFEAPFEMLDACHERVERMLRLLVRLQEHLRANGWDADAAKAATDVMRYFDLAAPLHHEDEERHVFPPLLASGDPALRETVLRLQQDHRDMAQGWARAREVLATLTQAPELGWDGLTPEDSAALTGFACLYGQHLKDEDGVVYPAAQARLSDEALRAMSGDMMRRRGQEPG